MNEIHMTNLMNSRFGHISASEHARAKAIAVEQISRPMPVRSRRWTFALGTAALATIAAGVFLLTPRTSNASAAMIFKQVQDAISNARTMKAVGSYEQDGKFSKYEETYYEDRKWLSHGLKKDSWTLYAGDRIYQWKGGSNDATVDDSHGSIVSIGGQSIPALDYVLGNFKTGTPYSTQQLPHEDVNGKPTYLLHVEVKFDGAAENDWKKSCEIVVDKQSDLPISVVYYDKVESNEQTMRVDFEFNKNFSAHQFEPVFGHAKIIRDLTKVRNEKLVAWSTPLATVTNDSDVNEVREIDVNPDGTILMMYTGAPDGSTDPGPEGLEHFLPTSISDSQGTVYLRMRDEIFAGWLEKDLKMNGHFMGVIQWIPLEPKQTTSDLPVQVGFAKRIFSQTVPAGTIGGGTKSLDLVAKTIGSKYPDWADAVSIINHYDDPAPAVMRGDYYKAHGNLKKAADWYEQSYKDAQYYFVNVAYRKLLPAIDCLEQLGDTKNAIRLKRTMLHDKSKDIHLTLAEREAAKKELQGLH